MSSGHVQEVFKRMGAPTSNNNNNFIEPSASVVSYNDFNRYQSVDDGSSSANMMDAVIDVN